MSLPIPTHGPARPTAVRARRAPRVAVGVVGAALFTFAMPVRSGAVPTSAARSSVAAALASAHRATARRAPTVAIHPKRTVTSRVAHGASFDVPVPPALNDDNFSLSGDAMVSCYNDTCPSNGHLVNDTRDFCLLSDVDSSGHATQHCPGSSQGSPLWAYNICKPLFGSAKCDPKVTPLWMLNIPPFSAGVDHFDGYVHWTYPDLQPGVWYDISTMVNFGWGSTTGEVTLQSGSSRVNAAPFNPLSRCRVNCNSWEAPAHPYPWDMGRIQADPTGTIRVTLHYRVAWVFLGTAPSAPGFIQAVPCSSSTGSTCELPPGSEEAVAYGGWGVRT